MVEKLIVKLLKRISEQLEGVSAAQTEIRQELRVLQKELAKFEEFALRNLEEKAAVSWDRSSFLN